MTTNRLPIALTAINLVLLIVGIAQSRMLTHQTIPEVLRIRAFELVDENGKVRAPLNADTTNGEVIFRLRDQQETIRVKLGASGEIYQHFPSLQYYDVDNSACTSFISGDR